MSRRESDAGARDGGEESFLQRWSRLKSESRDSVASNPAEVEMAANVQGAPQAPPRESALAAEPAPPPLPDLDLLDQDSDYSAFLSPKIDRALRRKALRKLFHSPKFNVCDGLDDYCEDFSQWSPLGAIVTADMRHHIERAAREFVANRDAPEASGPLEEGDADRAPGGPTGEAMEPEPTGTTNSDDREST